MRDGRPSTTAALVAAARGLAGIDPAAAALLPPAAAAMLRLPPGLLERGAARAFDLATGGLVRHLALRTAAIDAAIAEAVTAKEATGPAPEQLVLLGVGLDSRPWRLAGLQATRVFEVDHPATAAWRRGRADALGPPKCRERVEVVVDFARDDLRERLRANGFDAAAASVFIWEGVTMYLPPEATAESLAAIAALSAPGSTLCMSYMVPVPALGAASRRALHATFGALGEPLIGLMPQAQAAAMLDGAGFDIARDGSNRRWAGWAAADSAGDAPKAPLAYRPERLAIATRRAG